MYSPKMDFTQIVFCITGDNVLCIAYVRLNFLIMNSTKIVFVVISEYLPQQIQLPCTDLGKVKSEKDT